MYIVRDSNRNIIAIATRYEDAETYLKTTIDKTQYSIEKS